MPEQNQTDFDLWKLLTGEFERIRYVNRFSTVRVYRQENVAEHSFYCAFYAMFVCEWMLANGYNTNTFNPYRVLAQALVHDIEEARTGDIPRPYKHSLPKAVSAMVEPYTSAWVMGTLSDMFGDMVDHSPARRIYSFYANAKSTPGYEGPVVKFADFLAVIAYLLTEIQYGSNTIMQHIRGMRAYGNDFNSVDYDFIRPLVDQAQEILEREILIYERTR